MLFSSRDQNYVISQLHGVLDIKQELWHRILYCVKPHKEYNNTDNHTDKQMY